DAELMGEPVDDRRCQGVVPPADTGPAELREVAERRLALRHGEAREAVLLEAEVDRTGRRDLAGGGDPLGPGAGGPGIGTRAEAEFAEAAVAGAGPAEGVGTRAEARLAVPGLA